MVSKRRKGVEPMPPRERPHEETFIFRTSSNKSGKCSTIYGGTVGSGGESLL